jgi:RNA recognition motif-containing protein
VGLHRSIEACAESFLDNPIIESTGNICQIEKELATNIYIGNLSQDLSVDDLIHAFEGFGKGELGNLIKDTGSGESKRFGFLEICTRAEAKSAIRGPMSWV